MYDIFRRTKICAVVLSLSGAKCYRYKPMCLETTHYVDAQYLVQNALFFVQLRYPKRSKVAALSGNQYVPKTTDQAETWGNLRRGKEGPGTLR